MQPGTDACSPRLHIALVRILLSLRGADPAIPGIV